MYIKKEDLVKNKTYLCDARNFTKALWNGVAFEYTRYKFGQHFPDAEFHYDDKYHGTCKPIRKLD